MRPWVDHKGTESFPKGKAFTHEYCNKDTVSAVTYWVMQNYWQFELACPCEYEM